MRKQVSKQVMDKSRNLAQIFAALEVEEGRGTPTGAAPSGGATAPYPAPPPR